MTSIPVGSDEEWRALRLKHVGASDVAALFGLSPWLTRWQLYHIKKQNLPEAFEATQMTQGKHFEPAIAAYAQEKFDIQLRKVRRYLSSDDTPGMGASLDYEEFGDGKLIPTEMKWSLYGDGWDWEGDDLTAIPDYYMMQVQHQLACAPTAPHGQLIAFTGGDLKRMVIPRNERLIGAIREAVKEFWDDVAAGREPPVDFKADADAVTRMAMVRKLRSLVIPPEDAAVFELWALASAEAKRAEADAAAARAEVLKRVMDAGEGNDTATRVTCGPWSVSVSKVAENLGREIRAEDVGTRVGARKAYMVARLRKAEEEK